MLNTIVTVPAIPDYVAGDLSTVLLPLTVLAGVAVIVAVVTVVVRFRQHHRNLRGVLADGAFTGLLALGVGTVPTAAIIGVCFLFSSGVNTSLAGEQWNATAVRYFDQHYGVTLSSDDVETLRDHKRITVEVNGRIYRVKAKKAHHTVVFTDEHGHALPETNGHH